MLKFFKKFIEEGQENKKELKAEASVDKIKIAVCALLLEIAHCDDEFNDEEKQRIIKSLKNKFGLNDDEAKELIITAEKERDKSVDLWHFANVINKNYSFEEKLNLIEMLWEVIYADEVLDKHEDYLIHKLSKLLKLYHSDLISAKLKIKSK